MTIVLIIVAALVLILAISTCANKILSKTDFAGIAPYGKLVDVDGKQMQVYAMGGGEKTLVILPGMGSPLPSAEFAPLIRGLSKALADYTVVCVEYFGYGHSSQTHTPRTSENYVQETRHALKAAGFAPPYVLMPHSASGIYSEYYAAKYPEEVSAVIMLDTTSSAEKDAKMPGFLRHIVKVQDTIGIERLNARVISKALGLSEKNGYTPTEINDYKKLYPYRHNSTNLEQLLNFYKSVDEVMTMPFPENIPVLYLSATAKGYEAYKAKHIARLGKNAKPVTLKGNHMLHIKTWQDILPEAKTFLNQI